MKQFRVIGELVKSGWYLLFGAIGPSSGTAAMMKLSRIIGELVKSGRYLRPLIPVVALSP